MDFRLDAALNLAPVRQLEDLGDSLVSLFVLIFSIVAVPLSLFVACRGVVLPRMAAFVSVVAVGFVGAFISSGSAFVIGMSYILIATIVIFVSPKVAPFLSGFNAALILAYTIFTMCMRQVVNTPSGYVPASTDPTLPIRFAMPDTWVLVLVSIVSLAASAIFGATASKLGRNLLILSSSIVGIFFSMYLAGAYFSRGHVESSYDYFKYFALKPVIAWPITILLTGLTSWIQFATTKPDASDLHEV